MVEVIPIEDPLGPANITLLLDDCPLPTKVGEFNHILEMVFRVMCLIWKLYFIFASIFVGNNSEADRSVET